MAPSYEEIAGHFGISSPSVNGMVKTLERRGLLSRVPGVARSLRVLVPAAQLPGGDFGPPPAPRPTSGASAQDAATAAAIAVLDVLMLRLKAEERQELVLEAARSVQAALVPLVGQGPSMGVGAAVAAEAARWTADGRGTVARRQAWAKH
jgi:DNA-binding Lrp family transcriptional regulator